MKPDRTSRGDSLEPASQIKRARRLDDHVDVNVLDRVINEPESPAHASLPPASLELGNELRSPERKHVLLHLQRDVTWMTRCQPRPSSMRIAT